MKLLCVCMKLYIPTVGNETFYGDGLKSRLRKWYFALWFFENVTSPARRENHTCSHPDTGKVTSLYIYLVVKSSACWTSRDFFSLFLRFFSAVTSLVRSWLNVRFSLCTGDATIKQKRITIASKTSPCSRGLIKWVTLFNGDFTLYVYLLVPFAAQNHSFRIFILLNYY